MKDGGTTMEEAQLRARVRSLLREAHPDDPQVDRERFRGAQFDLGLAFVHFPEGAGGLDLPMAQQAIVNDELQRGARTHYRDGDVNLIGIGMAAPALLAHGTPALAARLLRPLFTGAELWCQLFSEPGAGSDVAALATRARRRPEGWRVDGQKVWTSLAHRARWGLLLARTDPEQPKHKGITAFVLDMRAPGVEVRPLYQLTGEAEFNEVFLSDVPIPDEHRLGAPGDGWRVAMSILSNERTAIGGTRSQGRRQPIDGLIQQWRARAGDRNGDPGARAIEADRLCRLVIEARLLQITARRASLARRRGQAGAEAAVGKLMTAELTQRIYETGFDLLGEAALAYPTGYALRRETEHFADADDRTIHRFLRSRASTIEGGTSEVMRNILGERILGLPESPRADKDRNWSELRHGGGA